jgi:oligopeptide transport system ATP-binding protein
VQAQVMDLLADLRREYRMGLILITHDLGVVADVADRIAVMYAGRVVEHAPVRELYAAPAHPYTRGLLDSVPRLDRTPRTDGDAGGELPVIRGLPPSLLAIPPGCAFHPRCPLARPVCRTERPPLHDVSAGRTSACHFWRECVGESAEQPGA